MKTKEQNTEEEVSGLEDFKWDQETTDLVMGVDDTTVEPKIPQEPVETDEPETIPKVHSEDEPVEDTNTDVYAQQLYENFKELGLIKTKEFKEGEPVTQESLIELMEADREAIIQERIEAELNEFVGAMGEDEKLALTFIKKGGKIRDFANLYSGTPVKLDGDITNEAYQDEIIRYYEKNYNNTADEDISEILEAFTTSGKKELRAKTYLHNLSAKVKEEQDNLVKQQEVITAQRKQSELQDMTAIKTTVNELKTVKNKTELINYLTQKEVELENGRKISKFQYELGQTIADPKKRVILAQLLQSGFDFSKVERQIETKVAQKFKEGLIRNPTQVSKAKSSWDSFKF